MGGSRATIAIFNASADAIDVLAEHLGDESHVVRTYIRKFREGSHDLTAFVEEHNPRVVIWDISIPYYRNWEFLQKILNTPILEGRRLIITTPNAAVLRSVVGSDTGAIELAGRSEDLERLVQAVSAALDEGR